MAVQPGLCGTTARFVSDLVGNPEDRFSQNEAHFCLLICRARKGDFDNLIAQEIAGDNRQTDDNANSSRNNADGNILLGTDVSDSLETQPITVINDDDDEVESAQKVEVSKNKENLKGKRKVRTGDKFLDADTEDELALAIRKSKQDIRSRHSSDIVKAGPSSSPDSIYDKVRGYRNSSSLEKEPDLDKSELDNLLDRDLDKELAIAIENSKRDTRHDTSVETGYNSISDSDDTTPMPLMQYHCSLSTSVTCTAQSPKKKDINSNVYRPKINRTKEYNVKSPLISASIATGLGCAGQRNLAHLNEIKISKDFKKDPRSYSKQSNILAGKLPDEHMEYTPWLSSFNPGNNSLTDLDNKRTGRKHKSPFIDASRVENQIERVSKTIIKKKKVFSFNPDDRFLERNVLNLKDSNVNDKSNHTKSKGSVSDVASKSCVTISSESYNSDEDIFDNDVGHSNINTSNTRSNKSLEDVNSSGFRLDSSSDSLPDLMVVSSDNNTDASLQRYTEKNTDLKPRQLKAVFEKSRSKSSEITVSHSDDDIDSCVIEDKVNVRRTKKCYQIVTDEDIEEKIDMILCVLPQLDREKCFWLLHRFLGKVDQCIEHVLQEENKLTQGGVIDLDD